jgi:TolB protein
MVSTRTPPLRGRSPLATLTATALAAAALAAAAPSDSHAQQDTARREVRIGLTYQPGVKPGVAVLPIAGADSVRAMIERDLDFTDRVEILGRGGAEAFDAARGGNGRAPNYGVWRTLGAAAVVQGSVVPGGVRVALHDVGQQKVLETRDFALPEAASSPEWRLAVHGVSDEITRWITGQRGAAQTRVLYVRARQVYVIDSDGAGETALTQGATALSPAWHPSGRYVAYSTIGNRGSEVQIRDLQSGQTRALAGASGGLNITPEWSPDGRSIVFARGQETGTDLYLADAFGGGAPQRLTVGRGTDNVSPSFSPDGRRIAFTSGRSGHPEIYTMDADGANAELLTPFQFGEPSYRSSAAWSPDGRLVAFQSRIAGRFQIVTINLRDRTMRQLTSEGINEDPSWAPDGRHLVFTSDRTGTKQLWVLDVETGRARQLTRSGGARLAAWSRVLGGAP